MTPTIYVRFGHSIGVHDGRPDHESMYQLLGNIRGMILGIAGVKDTNDIAVIVTRDTDGLDRGTVPLMVKAKIDWTKENVTSCEHSLWRLKEEILKLLDEYDPRAEIIESFYVEIDVGGQRLGQIFSRTIGEAARKWTAQTLRRALADKRPFGFN